MKKANILLLFLLVSAMTVLAQAPRTRSYIKETTFKVPHTNVFYYLDLTDNEISQTVQHLDGFGRPIQQTAVAGSPKQRDIVQPIVYDALGRQVKGYLPYTVYANTGIYQSTAIADQKIFYNTPGQKIALDTNAFSQQVFENSPLQRVLQSGSVGAGFQPGQHYKSVSYRSNTSGETIRQWNPDGSAATSYATGTLSVTHATDEEGGQAIVYVDKNGRTVLKKQYLNEGGTTWTETYYVYDMAGQLIYIVPPGAVAAMASTTNYNLEQSGLAELVFKYVYDHKGRAIEKKVPGKGWAYLVYDALDRLVLAQDAKLRAANQWNYIKYDYKGRAISQGIHTNASFTTRSAMQAYVSGLNYGTNYAERRTAGSADGYYTNNTFPTTSIEPLAYSYFDDYDLDRNGTADYSYAVQGLTGEASPTSFSHGLPTMVRKRTVGNGLANIWLTSVTFYDREGTAIQTLSNNQLNTTVNSSSTIVPDFTGKTLRSKTVQVAGSITTTIAAEFTYDHRDRLKTVDEAYNGGSPIRVAAYFYNELGQLVDKKLHSTNSGSTYLQSIDYRYSIRGQLTSINNSTLSIDDRNDDSNDVFGMELLYDKVDAGIGNTAYYNGAISAIKWKANAPGVAATTNERSYRFTYDKLLRLKHANYADRSGSGSWGNIGAYDEKNISYDLQGNILTLQRNAVSGGSIVAIDDLNYSYTANRLDNVTDGSGGSYGLFGFRNLTASTATYGYDADGNTTSDPKKGLSLSYNVLNRTERITITTATGRYIDYTYGADGQLIRKQAYDASALVKTTDYIGGFVYENGTLAYFGMTEGRVRNTGGTLKSEYFVKDQQGNVRVSFEEQGGVAVVRQENSYYPFGLTLPGSTLPTAANKNLYNGGAEWQDDFGNLPDLQHTFYRMYDAALGRFLAVDPLAQASESFGTYHYALDNPVMYNDPLGDIAHSGSASEFWAKAEQLAGGKGRGGFQYNNGTGEFDEYSEQGALYLGGRYMTRFNLWGSAQFDSPYGPGAAKSLNDAFARFDGVRYNDPGNGTTRFNIQVGRNQKGAEIYTGIKIIGTRTRPDSDGFLTKDEGIGWWRNGNGETLNVNLNQLDLSHVYASHFHGGVGSKLVVNFAMQASPMDNIRHTKLYDQGWVLGNVTLKLVAPNEVRAYQDTYNFDYKSNCNPLNWARNVDTWIGRLSNGRGSAYHINLNGSAYIQSNPLPIR